MEKLLTQEVINEMFRASLDRGPAAARTSNWCSSPPRSEEFPKVRSRSSR